MIPFNRPYVSQKSLDYIQQACRDGHLSGNGAFTKKCEIWLEKRLGCRRALLTHSGTASLEMAAILADIQPGDEVIMPSYAFVSTANAFVLRGAVPVFVDIRPDTLNIDENKIEAAVTPKTKAIVALHYAGVGCAMDAIMKIAERHNLLVIEDAAQAVLGRHGKAYLGTIGHLGALSFHETKTLHCGEGGALLINDARFAPRAEVLQEKGTDRSRFFRGEVDKYTWQDIGSSYLPSDLVAAFLWGQLEEADAIIERRMECWRRYHAHFAAAEAEGLLRRPCVPAPLTHNAHMYAVLLPSREKRDRFIERMKRDGMLAVFHFVPLHSSPAGRRYGRASGSLHVTEEMSGRIARLPLWPGLEQDLDSVAESALRAAGA